MTSLFKITTYCCWPTMILVSLPSEGPLCKAGPRGFVVERQLLHQVISDIRNYVFMPELGVEISFQFFVLLKTPPPQNPSFFPPPGLIYVLCTTPTSKVLSQSSNILTTFGAQTSSPLAKSSYSNTFLPSLNWP